MKSQAKCNDRTPMTHHTRDAQVDRLREEIINSRERDERADEERRERSLKELARGIG
jgi:hypothetical protein